MKTWLFSSVLLLTLISASQAQTEKGRWTIGAQVGNLSYQNQNGIRTWSASITPSAGYFITNGLLVGTGLPVSASSSKTNDDNTPYSNRYRNKSSTIGLSPFLRYFLGQSKLKPYVGLAYSYSKTKYDNTQTYLSGPSVSDGHGKITAFVPTVGLAYFVNRNLGLIVGLNYNINHQDQETTSTVPGFAPAINTYISDSKSVSLSAGFQLFIGQ